jgi:hypothetical protein
MPLSGDTPSSPPSDGMGIHLTSEVYDLSSWQVSFSSGSATLLSARSGSGGELDVALFDPNGQ